MKKIKVFFEKHKTAAIGGLSLLMIIIFYLFMKGRTASPASSPSYGIVPPPASSSGGGSVNTSGSTTGATGTPDNGSILSAISNSLQSLFNNQNTLNDKIAQVKDTVSQASNNVAAQLQATNTQTGAVSQAVSSLTQKINDTVAKNQPGTPAPDMTHSILSMMQSAKTALTNAHNGYYGAQDDTSKDFYHNAATVARANVLNAIQNAGANSGYSTRLVDSGAGYSNVIVTDPSGKQTKF